MKAARWLFTTVTPPASSPAAEEQVKSDQHSEEVLIPEGSEKGKPAPLAATGR
jgi:hypothetical protein